MQLKEPGSKQHSRLKKLELVEPKARKKLDLRLS